MRDALARLRGAALPGATDRDWRTHWERRGLVPDRLAASGLCQSDGSPLPFDEAVSLRQPWVDLLSVRATDRVLEVGCGAGVVLDMLTERTQMVVGMDFSRSMLSRYGGRAGLVRGDAAHLPFAAAAFDRVLLASVAPYFVTADYTLAVIRECLRVVAPGGRIVVGDLLLRPHPTYTSIRRAWLEQRLAELGVRYDLLPPTEAKLRHGVDRHDLVIDRAAA
jgi:ubiquinone/menaquinone biosynthesis C-methylase UbiE